MNKADEEAAQELSGPELGDGGGGEHDAFDNTALAVHHDKHSAVDQHHHHDEHHNGSGDDVIESRRDFENGVFREAGIDGEDILEFGLLIEEGSCVGVEDNFGDEFDQSLDDLDLHLGGGFDIGIFIEFEQDLLGFFIGDVGGEIFGDVEIADVVFRHLVDDVEVDAGALQLLNEIGAPLALVLVQDHKVGLHVLIVLFVNVTEGHDNDDREHQGPEQEHLVRYHELEVDESDVGNTAQFI